MKRILIAGMILLLLAIASCNKKESATDALERIKQQNIANAKSDFERECYINNHGWMKMIPIKNGEAVSETPCDGCMTDAKNHFCNFENYKQFVKGE